MIDEEGFEKIVKNVKEIIGIIGDDPERPGVLETPERVARAYRELFRGYTEPEFSVKTFASEYEGIIFKTRIPFTAHCEHHICPFSGTIDFAYIPNGRVIGISKIIRLMQHYASRLWIQEDMTDYLLDRFEEVFGPDNLPVGCAIIVEALHTCESNRGVKVPNVPTITSSVRGAFRTDKELENKFYAMVRK